MSVNQAAISGNLTRDPELRATSGGTQVLSLSVAVNERRKDRDTGEWGDYPSYVDVTVFGNRAEALSRFLAKGMKVAVSGRLHQERWQADDGTKRSRLGIVASEVDVMQRREQDARQAVESAFPGAKVSEQGAYAQDDIPF